MSRALEKAERKFAQLGRVNPLALEEFAALEQRHKFLTEQLADLTAAVAAQGRAQALDAARQAAIEAEGRERFRRFFGRD